MSDVFGFMNLKHQKHASDHNPNKGKMVGHMRSKGRGGKKNFT